MSVSYEKPWLSFDQQVELLVSRGLVDAAEFQHELRTIGYYRLSGYTYTFRAFDADGQRVDRFIDGATMARVVALYRYDERLRGVLWESICALELAVRVQVGYELGTIDRFVHMDSRLLDPRARPTDVAKFHEEISKLQKRSHEDFVRHFKTKYDGRLPVWVVTEILQLGQLVRLFEFAPFDNRRRIAATVDARADEYRSWLKAINIVRNIVAHHGRLWNRSIGMKPMLSKRPAGDVLEHASEHVDRIYGVIVVIVHLLRQLELNGPTAAIAEVLADFPDISNLSAEMMGVPEGWQQQPLWRG